MTNIPSGGCPTWGCGGFSFNLIQKLGIEPTFPITNPTVILLNQSSAISFVLLLIFVGWTVVRWTDNSKKKSILVPITLSILSGVVLGATLYTAHRFGASIGMSLF